MRVTILLLVTCSFASSWSSDQRRQADVLMARREAWQRTGRPEAVVSSAPLRDRTGECMLISASQLPRLEARESFPVKLPAEIAPGIYRVADASGRLETGIIHKHGPTQSMTRDLYFLVLPKLGPRYLIRIHPRMVSVDAQPPVASADTEPPN
jgi:hypothetical protein